MARFPGFGSRVRESTPAHVAVSDAAMQPLLWSVGVVPEIPPREGAERGREVQQRDQAGIRGVGQRALKAEVSGRGQGDDRRPLVRSVERRG